jgi:transposase
MKSSARQNLYTMRLMTCLESMDTQVQELDMPVMHRLAQGCQRLRTITGIGPQTSALLATLLSRLEFANADALVAYSGLDPRPNDSGAKHGRRRLSKKGPPLLRRQIYLAGFAASRSKALRPLYRGDTGQRLLDHGGVHDSGAQVAASGVCRLERQRSV